MVTGDPGFDGFHAIQKPYLLLGPLFPISNKGIPITTLGGLANVSPGSLESLRHVYQWPSFSRASLETVEVRAGSHKGRLKPWAQTLPQLLVICVTFLTLS